MLPLQKRATATVGYAQTGAERDTTNLNLYLHTPSLDEVSDGNIICQQLLDARAPDAIQMVIFGQ